MRKMKKEENRNIITFWITTKITDVERYSYLMSLIHSIFEQTSNKWLISINDDWSTIPFSDEIFNSPKIKVYRQFQSKWMFPWWNNLLDKCSTDFFIPMWDDDIIASSLVENLDKSLKENQDLDIYVPSWEIINPNGETVSHISNKIDWFVDWGVTFFNANISDLGHGLIISNLLFCCPTRKELLKSIGGYPDFGNPTDMYMSPILSLRARTIFFQKESELRIRRHWSNASNKNILGNYKKLWLIATKLSDSFGKILDEKSKINLRKLTYYRLRFCIHHLLPKIARSLIKLIEWRRKRLV